MTTRAIAVTVAAALFCALPAGGYTIPHSVIGSGGSGASGSSYQVTGTIGQPVIGVMSGSSFESELGFWYMLGDDLTGVDDPVFPTRYALQQNSPNPFNPVTTVRFSLPRRAHVTLKVYSAAGRVVRTLVDEDRDPGFYSEVVNANGLSSGVYFCRMVADTFVETRKMVLLK